MGLLSDIPDRCKVRYTVEYDEDGNQTGWHWEQAQRAYVGFAKRPDGSRQKFWIAADDVVGDDDFFSLPEDVDPGPIMGILCKINRDGDFRVGGYSTEIDEPIRAQIRKHGIMCSRELLKKWRDAGVLRAPKD